MMQFSDELCMIPGAVIPGTYVLTRARIYSRKQRRATRSYYVEICFRYDPFRTGTWYLVCMAQDATAAVAVVS